MSKIKEQTAEFFLDEKLNQLEHNMKRDFERLFQEKKTKIPETLLIKSGPKIELVKFDDIVYCSVDERIVTVQLIDSRIITSTKPILAFWEILKDYSFFRISKSHIVNIKHAITFHKDTSQVVMEGYTLLEISRRKKIAFLDMLETNCYTV